MVATEPVLALFNDSLERCTRSEDFVERFYRRFLENPEAEAFFADTDMHRQKRKLRASLFIVLPLVRGERASEESFDTLRERHGPNALNVPRHLYDVWLDALLEAVAETDPRYDEAVGEAWRSVMGEAIAYLTGPRP